MRLSPNAAKVIHNAVHAHFGEDAEVWLFGSRVDDSRKGGDIDLYVETDLTDGDTIFRKRIKLLAELSRPLAERKVDLVVKSRGSQQNLPIYQVARESGVRL